MSTHGSHITKLDNILNRLLLANKEIFHFEDAIPATLYKMSGRINTWSTIHRGIYVFLDNGFDSSVSIYKQVVRVGTHSIKKCGSKSTLGSRLRQHKGNLRGGGGNHRGSVFRLLVGDAIIRRDGLSIAYPNWGNKDNTTKTIRQSELPLEQQVSDYIRQLPFLIINVNPTIDGPKQRAFLERSLIAMISDVGGKGKTSWLGHNCSRSEVKNSGLWNNNHVNEKYDPSFLDVLEKYVVKMEQ